MYPQIKSKKGVALEAALMSLLLVSVFAAGFLVMIRITQDSARQKVEDAGLKNIAQNAANLGYVFFKQQMYYYYVSIGHRNLEPGVASLCRAPSAFLQSFRDGSRCGDQNAPSSEGVGEIFLFGRELHAAIDPNSDASGSRNLYSYTPEYCRVGITSSTCDPVAGGNKKVVTVGFENSAQQVAGHKFEYYLNGFDAENLRANFLVKIHSPTGKISNFRLTFSEGLNMIFAEGNSRLVTNFAESDAQCPRSYFGTFSIFNSAPNVRSCETPPIVGTLDGLANYKNRLFGFRRGEGKFFDMGSTGETSGPSGISFKIPGLGSSGPGGIGNTVFTPAPSYGIVNELGAIEPNTSPIVFPRHNRLALMGADDVDVLASKSGGQIFYVKGSGNYSHIGMLNMDADLSRPQDIPIPLCMLGEKGVGLGWDSIAVAGASDTLVTSSQEYQELRAANVKFRVANFILKSSTGGIYRAYVVQNLDGTGPLTTNTVKNQTYLQCFVVGDRAQEGVIEYRRVFSGTQLPTKPFSLSN